MAISIEQFIGTDRSPYQWQSGQFVPMRPSLGLLRERLFLEHCDKLADADVLQMVGYLATHPAAAINEHYGPLKRIFDSVGVTSVEEAMILATGLLQQPEFLKTFLPEPENLGSQPVTAIEIWHAQQWAVAHVFQVVFIRGEQRSEPYALQLATDRGLAAESFRRSSAALFESGKRLADSVVEVSAFTQLRDPLGRAIPVMISPWLSDFERLDISFDQHPFVLLTGPDSRPVADSKRVALEIVRLKAALTRSQEAMHVLAQFSLSDGDFVLNPDNEQVRIVWQQPDRAGLASNAELVANCLLISHLDLLRSEGWKIDSWWLDEESGVQALRRGLLDRLEAENFPASERNERVDAWLDSALTELETLPHDSRLSSAFMRMGEETGNRLKQAIITLLRNR